MIHLAWSGIDAGMGALLTYLVHSTAWMVAALLLTRLRRTLPPAARHAVWRAALIGPLASSAVMLVGCVCHRWQWALTQSSATGGALESAPAGAAALPLTRPFELLGASSPFGVAVAPRWSLSALLAAVWALVALAGLLLLARAAIRQRRALATRALITDAAQSEALDRVLARAGLRHRVRLSRCAAASTPFVSSAREVCLPERALELEGDALEAVLAHEVAHIERRDGWWLNGALLLQVLLWFQPLNRTARAELAATAELAADDRAVELTGNALGLARTLTQVAGWGSAARYVPSVAMTPAGSLIVERVARLVEASDGRTPGALAARTPWLTLALLAAIGACSPSVGAPRAERPRAAIARPSPQNRSAALAVRGHASSPAGLRGASAIPAR